MDFPDVQDNSSIVVDANADIQESDMVKNAGLSALSGDVICGKLLGMIYGCAHASKDAKVTQLLIESLDALSVESKNKTSCLIETVCSGLVYEWERHAVKQTLGQSTECTIASIFIAALSHGYFVGITDVDQIASEVMIWIMQRKDLGEFTDGRLDACVKAETLQSGNDDYTHLSRVLYSLRKLRSVSFADVISELTENPGSIDEDVNQYQLGLSGALMGICVGYAKISGVVPNDLYTAAVDRFIDHINSNLQ